VASGRAGSGWVCGRPHAFLLSRGDVVHPNDIFFLKKKPPTKNTKNQTQEEGWRLSSQELQRPQEGTVSARPRGTSDDPNAPAAAAAVRDATRPLARFTKPAPPTSVYSLKRSPPCVPCTSPSPFKPHPKPASVDWGQHQDDSLSCVLSRGVAWVAMVHRHPRPSSQACTPTSTDQQALTGRTPTPPGTQHPPPRSAGWQA
jgi:hypothetical protein